MQDSHGRNINYLRISVIDRCNLSCTYCMPEKNIHWLKHEDILSFEEIVDVVKYGVELGIDKVRLTGGEPLVRRNIVTLVAMLAEISGIKDLAMTTNAILLPKYAQKLKDAGLHRVNISLDTLDPEKFQEITRGGDLTAVLKGIEKAQKAKLTPIKLNCVTGLPFTEADTESVRHFAKTQNLEVRFIKLMQLNKGEFSIVDGGSGGDCPNCNRLRLLSDGTIRSCLFSDVGFNIRKLGVEKAFQQAIKYKPKQGTISDDEWMYKIGG